MVVERRPPAPSVGEPSLFGASCGVYVRIVRLVLAEKGVAYRLVERDRPELDGPSPDGPPHHAFGRVPAFEHDGFVLHDTTAITRYIDEGFAGPALQPASPRGRARMHQIISLLDNLAYHTLVWDIFVERVRAAFEGRAADQVRIAAALPIARTCLDELVELMADAPYLAGERVTLADLHAAPMMIYAQMSPEGAALMRARPTLGAWLTRIGHRASVGDTRTPLEVLAWHSAAAAASSPRPLA
ncbi:MAG TPA: glutathione S-transferase family protein [Kofleriaceae bacterium]|jgi:glutathione S-transferase|nr:glutathione S-transferase family protein [Kofleriaceae bacterium]